MTLSSLLGINYTSIGELLLIAVQLLCFFNAYYVTVLLLGPLPFAVILLLTLLYSRALFALHLANTTHLDTNRHRQGSRFCKKCKIYVLGRDHHCIFTGRCVQRQNYGYFVSYLLYSYLLSCHTLFSLLREYQLIANIFDLQIEHSIPLGIALISSIYFLVFTGGLLASSFRSIFLGIYTVEQIKKEKEPQYSNGQIRRMWLSPQGRTTIMTNFKENWRIMVSEESTFWRIVLVY